jgi:hypothetical protein
VSERPIVLDRVIFEVRYGSGYRYYDKCGQILLDIVQHNGGWQPVSINPGTSSLENPEICSILSFNDSIFNFTAEKASKTSVEGIAEEAGALWRAIQANLGIEEFVRMATRLNYLLPCMSLEEALKLLSGSDFKVMVPKELEANFSIKDSQPTAVLEKNGIEYRVALHAVTRYEGVKPSDIMTVDPRLLSKDQKSYRLAKQRQIAEYNVNPMYAVLLDVDCVTFNPENIRAKEYILSQQAEVRNSLLHILGRLR